MYKYLSSTVGYNANLSAFSKNFSSESIPYSITILISFHFASKSSRLFLNNDFNLSATFRSNVR